MQTSTIARFAIGCSEGWRAARIELKLSHDVQVRIYSRLADAATFEEFVRRKFVGAKTFSLEDAESLIPLLDLCSKAGQHHVDGVVLAMAHRGRLNVLANILGKSCAKYLLVV